MLGPLLSMRRDMSTSPPLHRRLPVHVCTMLRGGGKIGKTGRPRAEKSENRFARMASGRCQRRHRNRQMPGEQSQLSGQVCQSITLDRVTPKGGGCIAKAVLGSAYRRPEGTQRVPADIMCVPVCTVSQPALSRARRHASARAASAFRYRRPRGRS